jgi:5-methylcytosine-specific restriction enzyme subunit McrC
LIPTEKLFEDFLFGFILNKFQYAPGIKTIQNQGDHEGKQRPLAVEQDEHGKILKNAFRIKPDIYISKESNDIIIDTKYKAIYSKAEAIENDKNKNGVSINDIYQMLAYTIKLDVNICHLIYPYILGVNDNLGSHYQIIHKNEQDISKVYFHRILSLIENEQGDLSEIIEEKERLLYNQLIKIINA